MGTPALDNIWNPYLSGILSDNTNDHLPCFIYSSFIKPVNKNIKVKLGIGPFSEGNLNSIKISIANIDWQYIFGPYNDPSEAYDILFLHN